MIKIFVLHRLLRNISSDFPISRSLSPAHLLSFRTQIDLKIGSIGEVIQSLAGQFDFVYIDADKKGCWNYLTALIGDNPQDPTRPSLLSPGALILTDNTLWKGRVVEEPMPSQCVMDKKQQRSEQLTRAIHDFNQRCASHPLLRTVMVPLRDGLTISRYVPNAP